MDPVVVGALREALRHERAIPLVGSSKGQDGKGLFPKRTAPYGQAIKVCLDKEQGFLDVAREERKGKTIRQLVRINDRGIEALVSHLPTEEYGPLQQEAAPLFRGKVLEHCLRSVRRRLGLLEEQRAQFVACRQNLAAAALELFSTYLSQLDADKSQVDEELASAVATRSRLAQEKSAYETARARERESQPTQIPPLALSEEALDYQRDISEQLVYAWQDSASTETQDALARVLFNVGVERIGVPAERVAFDGRWHHTDDELQPGDPAEVVRSGWRLVNQRGSYLIARARVKAASRREEGSECPR